MSISAEIANCKRCENNVPFFFEIRKQKIMLITASSTIQSSYAPLISVRFLRNLLYCLFGYEGVSEEGLLQFINEDGIYWTSFNKCYDRYFLRSNDNGNYTMDKFKYSKCGRHFLQREINSLKPVWIVVLGKAVSDAVKKLIEEGYIKINCEIVYSENFHKEKDYELINSIRTKVSKIIGTPFPKEAYDSKATFTKRKDSEVHLFSQSSSILNDAILLGTIQGNRPTYENKVEELWITGFVSSQKTRYYTFFDCWSSIETAIRTFLINQCDPSNENQINPEFSNKMLLDVNNFVSSFFKISESPIKNVNTCLSKTSNKELINKWRKLEIKLKVISKIRNAIVHNFGFVPYLLLYSNTERNPYLNINSKLLKVGISGFKIITNMVYISEMGIKEIIATYEEVKDLILTAERIIKPLEI